MKEVSKEEEAVLINYMSRVVTDHCKDTRSQLVPLSKASEKKTLQDDDNKTDNDATQKERLRGKAPKKSLAFEDLCGQKGMELMVASSKICGSYLEGKSLLIEPREKEDELVVVEVCLKNVSKRVINYQSSSKNIKYCLHVDSNSFLPLMTVAQNDIMYLDKRFRPNEVGKAMIFYQVKKGMKYDDTYIEIMSGNKKINIPISVDKK